MKQHYEHASRSTSGPEFKNVDVGVEISTMAHEEDNNALVQSVGYRQPKRVRSVYFSQSALSVKMGLLS